MADEDWDVEEVDSNVQKLSLGDDLMDDGENEERINELKEKFDGSGKSDANVAMELAKAYVENDDTDNAKEVLNDCLKNNSNDPNLYYALGKICADEGESDDAKKNLSSAVEQKGDHVDARFALASLALTSGNEEEALDHLKKLLDVDKQHLNALQTAGQILAGKKTKDAANDAIGYLKQALDVDTNDTRSCALLVQCYDFVGNKADRDAARSKLGQQDGRYCVSQTHAGDKIIVGFELFNMGSVKYTFAVYNKHEVHESKILADVIVENKDGKWVTHATKPEVKELATSDSEPNFDDVKALAVQQA